MALYRDQGVVLRTIKLGEADRIVNILSQSRGKIRAVAKGVRKPGSRFGSRLEPTAHVMFQCYEGRELDVVTQVETVDAFRHLRDDYASLTSALAMVEATDQVAQERAANQPLYQMLVRALRTLDEQRAPLVASAFFWKLLSLEGFHPMLEHCAGCGRAEPDGGFDALDLEAGGVLCQPCAGPFPRRVEPDVLAMVQRMLGGDLRRVLAEPDSPLVRDVERLALDALEHHVERRLRSAPLLASLHGRLGHWNDDAGGGPRPSIGVPVEVGSSRSEALER